MLNRVCLVGHLTRDPELKYTPQGLPVASMGIAVNRFTKNERGEHDVDFFNVVAWRQTAQFASDYLRKGRLISVDGRLQTRSWVAQDGTKRNAVEVIADNINPLGPRPDGELSPPTRSETAETERSASVSAPAPRQAGVAQDAADESDPFADS